MSMQEMKLSVYLSPPFCHQIERIVRTVHSRPKS